MLHQNLFVASQVMVLAMFQCSEESCKFYGSNPVVYVGQSIKRPGRCSIKVFFEKNARYFPACIWMVVEFLVCL